MEHSNIFSYSCHSSVGCWGWEFCSIQSCRDSCSIHLCITIFHMWSSKLLEGGKLQMGGFYEPGLEVVYSTLAQILLARIPSWQECLRCNSAVCRDPQALGKWIWEPCPSCCGLPSLHEVRSSGEAMLNNLQKWFLLPILFPPSNTQNICIFLFTLKPFSEAVWDLFCSHFLLTFHLHTCLSPHES